ncbi:MAG: NAD kinase [Prolixibacteraceae bacterium]|nr:NAD kinase [Prolixibacteraceae bacterium]
MNIAIFGLNFDPSFFPMLDSFFVLLKKRKASLYFYSPFYEMIRLHGGSIPEIQGLFNNSDDMPDNIQFFFSIGGDGTFLKAVSFVMKKESVYMVGVNFGHLGFLSAISKENIESAVNDVLDGKYEVKERTVLQVDGLERFFGDFNYALNELTVSKRDTSSMIRIKAYLNDEYLATYQADGLIIATPTGSTAYSLSVGGPILIPDTKNFLITPVAPHHLTVRPIVIPEETKVTLQVEGRGQQFLASLDSRSEAIDFPCEIIVRKAAYNIKTLKLKEHSFFDTLRNKLMWDTDRRN